MLGAFPTAVLCSWCGKDSPLRRERRLCDHCGGALSAPAERGEEPPPAPRVLPRAYRRAALFSRNVRSIVGAVFLGLGIPFGLAAGIVYATTSQRLLVLIFGALGLLFSAVGAPLLAAGLGRGRRQLAALERGQAAEGEVVAVEQDLSVRINYSHPWRVDYTFPALGAQVRGSIQSYSWANSERRTGDRVWVVYLDTDPQVNNLWPPLR